MTYLIIHLSSALLATTLWFLLKSQASINDETVANYRVVIFHLVLGPLSILLYFLIALITFIELWKERNK